LSLRLYSPLAAGADQLAAAAALELGMGLQCPLPFLRDEYEKDFCDDQAGLEAFAKLLARAERVFQLDGAPGQRDEAYLEVGRLIIRHSDVLLAIWNGKPPAGPGGTAQIVAEAHAQGVPVIWINPDDSEPAELMIGTMEEPQ